MADTYGARPGGLGAVLMQLQDGHDRVIAYASRSLRDHEKNYGAFLLEMAAAVYGIEHFDTYLVGRQFVLKIDHKPLERMSQIHQKTLNRLQQLMLEHDFVLEYTKGADHVVPDFLSRNVVAAVEATGISIQQLQQNDPEIKDVQNILTKGVPFRERLPLVDRKVLEKVASQCDMRDGVCLLYTSPSPRDKRQSRMPSSA